MKYIVFNKKTKEQKILEAYPRKDISEPLVGAEDIRMYVIIDKRPIFDENKSSLKIGEIELTSDVYENHKHLLIANQLYDIIDYPKEVIINKLNTSLGNYLDEQYPLWERAKHAGEGNYILLDMIVGKNTTDQLDRKLYIDSVYNWITKCRADRALREKEYLENDIFPSFEWDKRPII